MPGLIQAAEAALDRRLTASTHAPVALALSGGGDSMALLHLASGWAQRRRRRLLALTVDHGLHADSAAWTAFAGKAAEELGAAWRALHWRGEKPATGLPTAARAARHRLLADAAREAGATVILFAHTADDVAEGEVMRAADAPRLGYLQAWSPSPAWPEGRGVFILRPLLEARRSDLRACLRGRGSTWLDDPANEDLRFARPRARAALAGADLPSAAEPGERATRRRGGADLAQRAALAVHSPDGRIAIPASAFGKEDRRTILRLLSICIACASGAASPARTEALERLLRRIEAAAPFVASLGGARIAMAEGLVTFSRLAGDLVRAGSGPLTVRAGTSAVWDGRFEIAAEADIEIAALAGSAARLAAVDRRALASVPAAVRPALPAIFHRGAVLPPQPFGRGPAFARALAERRFAAACGLIADERDISPPSMGWGMAQGGRSSYVEALALA